MKCEEFLLKIDAYIDGELSNEEVLDLRAHAATCNACRLEMEKAELLRDTLSHIDDDISVPLEAQAAWRKAVRAEAKHRSARKWMKGLYVVAAALVLVLGCTLMLKNDIFANKRVPTAEAPEKIAAAADEGDALMIAADGENGKRAAVASYTAVQKYNVDDLEAAGELICNLAVEYEAYAVDKADLGDNVFYSVELPMDNQQDFLSALSMLGEEVDSMTFEPDGVNANVRIDLIVK